jgi:hypothetical protein
MHFSVKMNPYPRSVHVVVSKDLKYVNDFLKAKNKNYALLTEENLDNCYGMTFAPEDESPAVWLESVPTTPSEMAHFVHECDHACKHIADSLGMSVEEKAGESCAYMISFLVEQALTKFTKLKQSESKTSIRKKNEPKATAQATSPDSANAGV